MSDLVHFIELNDIGNDQKVKVFDKIQELRQERRKMKDLLVYLKAIDKYIDLKKTNCGN